MIDQDDTKTRDLMRDIHNNCQGLITANAKLTELTRKLLSEAHAEKDKSFLARDNDKISRLQGGIEALHMLSDTIMSEHQRMVDCHTALYNNLMGPYRPEKQSVTQRIANVVSLDEIRENKNG